MGCRQAGGHEADSRVQFRPGMDGGGGSAPDDEMTVTRLGRRILANSNNF